MVGVGASSIESHTHTEGSPLTRNGDFRSHLLYFPASIIHHLPVCAHLRHLSALVIHSFLGIEQVHCGNTSGIVLSSFFFHRPGDAVVTDALLMVQAEFDGIRIL